MTLEEIKQLIRLYGNSCSIARESALAVKAAKRIYGEEITKLDGLDYDILREWRDAEQNLIEAITKYGKEKYSPKTEMCLACNSEYREPLICHICYERALIPVINRKQE
jgi:hypothetical protein